MYNDFDGAPGSSVPFNAEFVQNELPLYTLI